MPGRFDRALPWSAGGPGHPAREWHALTAYSPLALGRVFRDTKLQRIGERYGMNAGQVALRWLLQQDGVMAIPRSSAEANAKANFRIFDFELADSEMAEIPALATPAAAWWILSNLRPLGMIWPLSKRPGVELRKSPGP